MTTKLPYMVYTSIRIFSLWIATEARFNTYMIRRLLRRWSKATAAMQQQQHSQVAAVASPTRTHSHHFLDSWSEVPAKSVAAKLGFGSKAAVGADAGAELLLVLPLPPAATPSMDAETLLPLAAERTPIEEREFGAKAAFGAMADGAKAGPYRPAAASSAGVFSPDALSMEATPLAAKLPPNLMDCPDRVATGPAAGEAALPTAEACASALADVPRAAAAGDRAVWPESCPDA